MTAPNYQEASTPNYQEENTYIMTNDVTVAVETITPDRAEWLLSRNNVNRALRSDRVESYARQMTDGLWRLTGEPITLNGTDLLNGQHRLSACVKAGVPFTTVVVRGVATDAMRVMDSGLPRSVADALGFEGHTNTRNLSALTRLVLSYEQGIIRGERRKAMLISRDAIIDFVNNNAGLAVKASGWGADVWQVMRMSRAAWSAVAFLLLRSDEEAASSFLTLLTTGENLPAGSPILALRSWALQSIAAKRRRETWEIVGASIKAWNAWLQGDEIKLLKFLPSEDFPEVATP